MKTKHKIVIPLLISVATLVTGLALRHPVVTRVGIDFVAFFAVVLTYVLFVRKLAPFVVVVLTLVALVVAGILFYVGGSADHPSFRPLAEGIGGGLLFLVFMTSSDTGKRIIAETQRDDEGSFVDFRPGL